LLIVGVINSQKESVDHLGCQMALRHMQQ